MVFHPAAFSQQPAADALRGLTSLLNSRIEATVVRVSGDGTVVLEVPGLQAPVTVTTDLPVSEGELINLVFRRSSEGGIVVELIPAAVGQKTTAAASPFTDLFIEGQTGRLLSEFLILAGQKGTDQSESVRQFREALIKLLAMPLSGNSSAPSLPTAQPLPAQGVPGSLTAAVQPELPVTELTGSPPTPNLKPAFQPVPPLLVTPAPVSGGTSSNSAVVTGAVPASPSQSRATVPVDSANPLLREFIRALVRLEADPTVPPALKVLLPSILESLKSRLPELQSMVIPHPLEILKGEKPLLELLRTGPLTAHMEKSLPDGRVRLTVAGMKSSVEAMPPFPLKAGSEWRLHLETDNRVTLSEKPEPVRVPGRILELVRQVASEAGFTETAVPVKGKEVPLPRELTALAARIDRLSEALRLTPDDEQALVRSVLFLSDKGEAGRSVRPELALYPALKGFGETLADLLTRLENIPSDKNPEVKKAVEDLIKTLSVRFALPLLSYEGEGRGQALKTLLEEGGQFFENKLFKALSSEEKTAGTTEKDLKAILNRMSQLIDNMDIAAPVRERIQQETGKLLQSMDSLQVRAMAENDAHHILVPFVQAGEVRSAYVAVKKRTRRKKIDPENAALTLRVSPSALGDVEGRVEIRQGRLDIHFVLGKEKFARLFESSTKELAAHVERAGYALGQVRTSLFRSSSNGEALKAQEPDSKTGGFDITV